MRSRNIKPGFFKNDVLAEIEPLGRILFTGLWCMADREGRLENRPKKIKAEVLPYDNCNMTKLLKDLTDKNFITQYSVNGCNYIEICNFIKHQTPHIKEQSSTIPAPDLHQTRTSLESLIPDSLNLIPDMTPSGAKPVKKSNQKTSLPDDFKISEEVRLWADKKGHNHLDQHLEAFIDLCKANGYTALDWDSKFKNAIRNDWGKINGNNTGKSPPQYKAKDILAAGEGKGFIGGPVDPNDPYQKWLKEVNKNQ